MSKQKGAERPVQELTTQAVLMAFNTGLAILSPPGYSKLVAKACNDLVSNSLNRAFPTGIVVTGKDMEDYAKEIKDQILKEGRQVQDQQKNL